MKKILFIIVFILFHNFNYAQVKTFVAPNGKVLTEKEYYAEKSNSLENTKKNLGKDYELYEQLELVKKDKDSIKYKFKWEFMNKEILAEKLVEKKLIGTKLDFQKLNFLYPKEKNKIDENKPTFINFWFTSCPPCIVELPALNYLKEKYENKVNFLSITFENKQSVEKFLTNYEFNFIHIVGEREFINSLGFVAYPKTFLLDKNKFIKSIEGSLPSPNNKHYETRLNLIEEKINKLF